MGDGSPGSYGEWRRRVRTAYLFFFSSRRRHTRLQGDWSSDVCSSDLRDFPVFLHPETHEEYALARTERKSGPGYRGFVVQAAPDVTLEQDLARRDLTINAMAAPPDWDGDRKSTRLNSSHLVISYAVFCLKNTNRYAP